MPVNGAKVVLTSSVVLLFAVGAAWYAGAGDASADLSGRAVQVQNTRSKDTHADTGDHATQAPQSSRATPARPATAPATTSTGYAAPPVEVQPKRPAFPKRLSIPSLDVDAVVVSVGLETDGSMEIPGATEAGWYHYGPRPGDAFGSAVVAGHVDHEKQPGVFVDLRRIELGADISVFDDNGNVHAFTVIERFQIDKDELPSAELFRSDGDPVLTLITCGGRFSSRSRSYVDNIVIRATPNLETSQVQRRHVL